MSYRKPQRKRFKRKKDSEKSVEREISELRRKIDRDPDNPSLFAKLGNVYARKDWKNTAITCYKKALELNPEDVQVHIKLGTFYLEKSWLPEAVQHFEKALVLAPDNVTVLISIGNAYLNGGFVDKAIELFKRALSSDPDNQEAEKALRNAYAKESEIKLRTFKHLAADSGKMPTDGGQDIDTESTLKLDAMHIPFEPLPPVTTIKGSGIIEAPQIMKPANTYKVSATVTGDRLPTGIENIEEKLKETISLAMRSSLPIEISASGEAFHITPNKKTVLVPLWGESKTVVFSVIPKQSSEGNARLLFRFCQGNTTLGIANMTISVSSSWMSSRHLSHKQKITKITFIKEMKIHV